MAMLFLASGGVARVLSYGLQRVVSGPILHLTQTVKRISRDKDYSVRAVRTTQDELGARTDSFNEMLAEIQAAVRGDEDA